MPTRTVGRRWLPWVVGAVVLAVVLGGVVWAASRPKPARYTTATVTTGTVTESWTATGPVTRVAQVAAAFAAVGEVTDVHVALGDRVAAGQELATIDPTQLDLAVAQARAGVAQARAQLDADLNGGSANAAAAAAAAAAKAQADALAQVQAQLRELSTQLAAAKVEAATARAEATATRAQLVAALKAYEDLASGLVGALTSPACVATFAAASGPRVPLPTALPSGVPSALPSTLPSTLPSGLVSALPSGHPSGVPSTLPSGFPTALPSTLPTALPSGFPTTLPTTLPTGPGAEQALTCLATLTALPRAAAPTALPTSLPTTLPTALPTGLPGGVPTNLPGLPTGGAAPAAPAPAVPGLPAGLPAAGGSNEGRVAASRATLLQAEQALATAERARENAVLRAPIAGEVGALTLTEGLSSVGRTVTIVGPGAAEVVLQAPLAVRDLLRDGQQVVASPPGSRLELTGTVSRIEALPTSPSGSPTYATTVTVADPEGHLHAGSVATVEVAVGEVRDAVVVPASAVSPTGATTGTLRVVEGGVAHEVAVVLGARGHGRVQVTDGVRPGQVVVLADHGVGVPANSFQQPRQPSASATPISSTGATAVPSATPAR